jgi:hypothetical protein
VSDGLAEPVDDVDDAVDVANPAGPPVDTRVLAGATLVWHPSLHGWASQADVSRAVDSVAEHFNEDARFSAAAGTTPRS